ncbi:MAG: ImmA/IrrE family metallo-endopeptidase [Solirubrobacteraceae bacterium]
MPLLRCTNEDCEHEWFERSQLAVGSECPICDAPTCVVGVDDEPPAELNTVSHRLRKEQAHPGHARAKARQVLREHGIGRPPVIVHAIARELGFAVRESRQLGNLSARLVGKVIEVNPDEPPVRRRFSVAHELGHYFLGTRHGDGPLAEQEADAFAGELLVPGHMLQLAMEQATDTIALTKLFKVSRQVVEIAATHHKRFDQLT